MVSKDENRLRSLPIKNTPQRKYTSVYLLRLVLCFIFTGTVANRTQNFLNLIMYLTFEAIFFNNPIGSASIVTHNTKNKTNSILINSVSMLRICNTGVNF